AVQTPRAGLATTGGGAPLSTTWRYHHDSLGNRLLAQQAQPPSDTESTMKAAYAPEGNRLGDQPMDEAGRPAQDGQRGYRWDGLGRLTSVTQDGKTTAYRYNRLGLRVAKQGDIQQHYLYDEQRHRLAELDAQGK